MVKLQVPLDARGGCQGVRKKHTIFIPPQALPSPAHLLQHFVALVVRGDGGVDTCNVEARGVQWVISSLVDGKEEIAICAEKLLLAPLSLQRPMLGPLAMHDAPSLLTCSGMLWVLDGLSLQWLPPRILGPFQRTAFHPRPHRACRGQP